MKQGRDPICSSVQTHTETRAQTHQDATGNHKGLRSLRVNRKPEFTLEPTGPGRSTESNPLLCPALPGSLAQMKAGATWVKAF